MRSARPGSVAHARPFTVYFRTDLVGYPSPEVCSFQLPEVCSFRLPLTIMGYRLEAFNRRGFVHVAPSRTAVINAIAPVDTKPFSPAHR